MQGQVESKKIKLEALSQAQMQDVVELWDEQLKFNRQKFDKLPKNNPFYPYISKNPPSCFPIRSILASVLHHYNAVGIIESPYLDLEFWDSYSGFYVTSFTKFARSCKRIHFFSGVNDENVKLLIDELLTGKSKQEIYHKFHGARYKGYTILRPTSLFVVGRTSIEFDPRSTISSDIVPKSVNLCSEEKKAIPILKAKQRCRVNLLSASFEINSPEFIQQDPHLGPCATASLWVTGNVISEKFGISNFRYSSITRSAIGKSSTSNDNINIIYNPFGPDKGLNADEIKNAIYQYGAGHQYATSRDNENPEEADTRLGHMIYSYVESGIPVILGLQESTSLDCHAVAMVGHSLPILDEKDGLHMSPIVFDGKKYSNHYAISSFIRLYYAHDDIYGPFNRVKILGARKKWLRRTGKGKEFSGIRVKLGRQATEVYHVTEVISPTPSLVKNGVERSFQDVVRSFEVMFGNYIVSKRPEQIFLWRSVLLNGSEFKRSINDRKYSNELKLWYSALHLPKYIWLHEVSVVKAEELYKCFPASGVRTIDGEFIYDATCPGYNTTPISRRMRRLIWDHSKENDNFDQLDDPKDGLYCCYHVEGRENAEEQQTEI